MNRSIHRAPGIAGVALLVAACGTGAAAPTQAPAATTAAAPTTPVFANTEVDIGGRTLHLVCVGDATSTRPTVVFEEGLGDDAGMWAYVMSQVGGSTRACAYDRAGNGQSPAVAGPRTTADQVDDLERLLDAAGIKAPIVLVGASLGGWNAMVYADRHPDRIAGIVFVDVRPPTASAAWLAELPAEQPGESEALAGNRDEFTAFELDPTRNPEALELRKSSVQAAATTFGAWPVTFLWAAETAGFWDGLDPELATRLDAVLARLRTELEAKAPSGAAISVPASHNIVDDAPKAVIDAIAAVLAK